MKKLISLQLDENLLNSLRVYSKSIGATLTGVIRIALIKYLKEVMNYEEK